MGVEDATAAAKAKEDHYFEHLKAGKCFHIMHHPLVICVTGFTKLFSMITMILGLLTALDIGNSFDHNPTVVQAYSTPFLSPVKSALFNYFESASKNEKLKNTKYMFAYNNGKSSARVCTDLKQKEFEELTGIEIKDDNEWNVARHIDIVNNQYLDTYNGACRSDNFWNGTEPPLAQYAGCLDWEDISNLNGFDFFTAMPDPLYGNIKRPAMGSCMPTAKDKKVLVEPRDTLDKVSKEIYPDHNVNHLEFQTRGGWMWHYMVRGTLFPGPNVTSLPSTDRLPRSEEGDDDEEFEISKDWKELKQGEWGAEQYMKKCEELTPDKTTARACKVCGYTLAKFNDEDVCEQNYVYSYYGGTMWVVLLFAIGTLVRIIILLLNISWGLTEKQLNYRIMFSHYSPLVLYSLCKHGRKTVVYSLATEHLQGWPWVFGLVDKSLIATLLLAVAWGADPFPQLAKGQSSLLLLWISAIGELYGLIHLMHITVTRKSWRVIGDRGVPCCCCKSDIPWPCAISQEAQDQYELAREEKKKARETETQTSVNIEMK